MYQVQGYYWQKAWESWNTFPTLETAREGKLRFSELLRRMNNPPASAIRIVHFVEEVIDGELHL